MFTKNYSEKPLDIFEINTITYSTASGYFLSVRCDFKLEKENILKFLQYAKIIQSDFNIDDLLTGAYSIEEAALIAKRVSDILKQDCFNVRKCYSNNPEVLKHVSENNS